MDALTHILKWLTVKGSTFGKSELTAPWGIIPECDGQAHFHLIEKGSCYLVKDGEVPLPLRAGDVVLLSPNLGYSLVDHPDTEAKPWSELFPEEALEKDSVSSTVSTCPLIYGGGGGVSTSMICGAFHFEKGLEHPIVSMLPPFLIIPRESQGATSWLQTTIQFLAYEACQREQGFDVVISGLVDVLFVQILRAWMASEESSEQAWFRALQDESIGRSLGFIHQEPQKNWTVQSLGKAVGMSRSGFAVRFQEMVGMPPMQYITRWRMQISTKLLQTDGKMGIAQIAREVGYQSEVSFHRAFRKFYGMTPGDWRKNIQDTVSV